LCPTIICCHIFHEIVNNFIFEQIKKFFLAKTIRIKVLFTQNLSLRYQIYGFGSVIRDPEKTYSESRIQSKKKAPDPGSATLIKIVCRYDLGPVPVKEAAGVKFHGDRKGEER
jgi:hypothetical protein